MTIHTRFPSLSINTHKVIKTEQSTLQAVAGPELDISAPPKHRLQGPHYFAVETKENDIGDNFLLINLLLLVCFGDVCLLLHLYVRDPAFD